MEGQLKDEGEWERRRRESTEGGGGRLQEALHHLKDDGVVHRWTFSSTITTHPSSCCRQRWSRTPSWTSVPSAPLRPLHQRWLVPGGSSSSRPARGDGPASFSPPCSAPSGLSSSPPTLPLPVDSSGPFSFVPAVLLCVLVVFWLHASQRVNFFFLLSSTPSSSLAPLKHSASSTPFASLPWCGAPTLLRQSTPSPVSSPLLSSHPPTQHKMRLHSIEGRDDAQVPNTVDFSSATIAVPLPLASDGTSASPVPAEAALPPVVAVEEPVPSVAPPTEARSEAVNSLAVPASFSSVAPALHADLSGPVSPLWLSSSSIPPPPPPTVRPFPPPAQAFLISFPRSGNSLLRKILEDATGVLTGSAYRDQSLYKAGLRGELAQHARHAAAEASFPRLPLPPSAVGRRLRLLLPRPRAAGVPRGALHLRHTQPLRRPRLLLAVHAARRPRGAGAGGRQVTQRIHHLLAAGMGRARPAPSSPHSSSTTAPPAPSSPSGTRTWSTSWQRAPLTSPTAPSGTILPSLLSFLSYPPARPCRAARVSAESTQTYALKTRRSLLNPNVTVPRSASYAAEVMALLSCEEWLWVERQAGMEMKAFGYWPNEGGIRPKGSGECRRRRQMFLGDSGIDSGSE